MMNSNIKKIGARMKARASIFILLLMCISFAPGLKVTAAGTAEQAVTQAADKITDAAEKITDAASAVGEKMDEAISPEAEAGFKRGIQNALRKMASVGLTPDEVLGRIQMLLFHEKRFSLKPTAEFLENLSEGGSAADYISAAGSGIGNTIDSAAQKTQEAADESFEDAKEKVAEAAAESAETMKNGISEAAGGFFSDFFHKLFN